MRIKRHAALGCASVLGLLLAPAWAFPSIEPGQWEVMTVKPGEQPFLHRVCLPADHLRRALSPRPDASDRCTDRGLRRQGKEVVHELRCTVPDGPAELRRSAWTRMSATHLENRIERVVQGRTEPVAQISMVRAGACPRPAASSP